MRVGIVGAGIGGLQLARRLRQHDIEPLVCEASESAGGVIRSFELEGRVLEAGPQRLRLAPAVRTLIDELGLGGRLLIAPADLPLFIQRGRLRRVPLSLASLATSDLFGIRTRLRVLLEPFTAAMRGDETVANAMTRRFGRRAYEDLLGPLFGGLYASDPNDMLVRHALAPILRELRIEDSAVRALARRRGTPPPACSFVDGLGELIAAMLDAVREHVVLGTPVRRVSRAAEGFTLETAAGSVTVDHVVLTCAAGEAASLLRSLAPDASNRLSGLHDNTLAIVHMFSDAPLRGLGFQTSLAERIETRGVTFNHALFGRTRAQLYTAFLGGARGRPLMEQSDERIADIASREFEEVTGHTARVVHVTRSRVPAWDRSWTALDGLRLPEGVHLCTNYESRIGIPGRLARADLLARELAQRAQAAVRSS